MGGTVSGSGENAKITGITKAGTLTLTVVFEHPTKTDKSLSGDFEITSTRAPAPTDIIWKGGANGLSEKFDGRFSEVEILNNVGGTKSGYRVKEITNLTGQSPSDVARIDSSNKFINYTKLGDFSVDITLEHSGKEEVTLRNNKFKITEADTPKDLVWKGQQSGDGLSKAFNETNKKFTEAEILNNVGGTKTGYAIKEITNLSGQTPSGNATIDSGKKFINYTKVGVFVANVSLEHPTKKDTIFTGAKFKISKANASELNYTNQSKKFVSGSGGEITNDEIKAGLTATSATLKNGYKIKSVSITAKTPNDMGGTVDGNGENAKITGIAKAGTLTLTIVFEHIYKDDKTFTGVKFALNAAPTDIALSKTAVDENKAVGSTVGNLTTTDVNAGDTFTYSLVSGDGSDDNGDFRIDGAVLKTAKVFDFETKNSYKIRIRTTDSAGGTFEKEFTITINNVTESISYAYNSGNKYVEAAANDGSIDNSKYIIATANGLTFKGANGATLTAGTDFTTIGNYQVRETGKFHSTVGGTGQRIVIYQFSDGSQVRQDRNLPAPTKLFIKSGNHIPSGLTMVVTKLSATTAKITFTGNATAHQKTSISDDSVQNVAITFNSTAFTGSPDISAVVGKSKNDIAIEYNYDPPVFSYSYNGIDGFYEKPNDGTVKNRLSISVSRGRFIAAPTAISGVTNAKKYNLNTHYTINNVVPNGLTLEVRRDTGGGNPYILFTGKATAHASANNVNNLSITLKSAMLQGSPDLSAAATKTKNDIVIYFGEYTIFLLNSNHSIITENLLDFGGNKGRFGATNGNYDGENKAFPNGERKIIKFEQNIIANPVMGTHFTVNGLPNNLNFAFKRIDSITIGFYITGSAVNHANSDDTTFTVTFKKRPTVTLYKIVPEKGVKISKIKNLEDDLAMSLAALGIRIIAPIPGEGAIGIEVPNKKPNIVSMKSVLASKKFQQTDMALPIAFGKTITNETFVVDLAKMPHLLMAGATGQGKSVGLNAILTSILYKKHPSEVKFVLVDPKKVELTLFSKIEKHYLAKLPNTEEAIITDTTKVVNTLNSLCIEMDDRYELLKTAKVRNIKEYNDRFKNRRLNPENGHRFLPYIVLVIDEFADLIMTAGKEVETPIARLAQLARAIGIHLIVATQRPSVNVITGIIKANFPSRIAFRVTAKVDSRTILDAPGADQLIGRGDMLYSGGSDITRLQCAFVDTPEVEKITNFIGEQQAYPDAHILPEYIPEGSEAIGDITPDERDPLFREAAEVLVNAQQGSASLLQRKLKLGYNRAGRIIDQLEAAGVVGPFEGSKARSVLLPDTTALNELLEKEKNETNFLYILFVIFCRGDDRSKK
uniref:DNA translocase FtsK n=1 Tax=Stylophora pistillata TaxID=50429 RepID=A0A2B4R9J9_STYPI